MGNQDFVPIDRSLFRLYACAMLRYWPYWYLLLGLALLLYGWSVAGAQPSCGQPPGYEVWTMVLAPDVTQARSWQVVAPRGGDVWLAHQVAPWRSVSYLTVSRAGNVALYNGWGVPSVVAPDWSPVGGIGQVVPTESLTVQVGASGVGWCLALPSAPTPTPDPSPTPVPTPTPTPSPPSSDAGSVPYLRATFSVLLYLAALWLLFKIYGGH